MNDHKDDSAPVVVCNLGSSMGVEFSSRSKFPSTIPRKRIKPSLECARNVAAQSSGLFRSTVYSCTEKKTSELKGLKGFNVHMYTKRTYAGEWSETCFFIFQAIFY